MPQVECEHIGSELASTREGLAGAKALLTSVTEQAKKLSDERFVH